MELLCHWDFQLRDLSAGDLRWPQGPSRTQQLAEKRIGCDELAKYLLVFVEEVMMKRHQSENLRNDLARQQAGAEALQ